METARMKIPELHRCTKGKTYALGYPSGKSFIVLAGSIAAASVAPTFECASKGYYNIRNRLISEGVIVGQVFTRDYEFSSPTAAAAIVTGWSISGNVAWIPIHANGSFLCFYEERNNAWSYQRNDHSNTVPELLETEARSLLEKVLNRLSGKNALQEYKNAHGTTHIEITSVGFYCFNIDSTFDCAELFFTERPKPIGRSIGEQT